MVVGILIAILVGGILFVFIEEHINGKKRSRQNVDEMFMSELLKKKRGGV